MPYTAAQLTAYYTSLTGVAPTGADAVLISAYAQQSQGGTLSDTNALLGVFNSVGVQATFEVAESTYQFFTGSGVSAGGLSYLEGLSGSGNANGLTTAYYNGTNGSISSPSTTNGFNNENRYYNFAINLASAGGAGNANFVNNYGNLTFAQTVASAYETIVGSSNVGNAAANAAIADIINRQAYFTAVANQRAGGVDAGGAAGQNIALKAVVVGYILEEANKADVGTYAKAIDQLEASVAAGNAQYGVSITQTYGSSGTGYNTGFAALGVNANGQTAQALTTGIDAINATTGSINYVGTVNLAGGNSNTVNPTTLQAGDQIRATGANNTLTVTTIGTANGAAVDATGGALISGVQTINVRAVADNSNGRASANAGAFFNVQGTVSGVTSLNVYQSPGPVVFNNVSTQSVGFINDGATTGGALIANYVAAATSATVNISGGTTPSEAVGLSGTGLVTVNLNSNGGLNYLGVAPGPNAPATAGLTLPNNVTTLNLAATSPLTLNGIIDTGLKTITATGSAAINIGEIGASVTNITTTGLTGTGALTAVFTAAPATTATFNLGGGADILTFGNTAARAAATGEAATTVNLTNTSINLGGGANALTVTGGLVNSTVIGGAAADTITVYGGVDATSVINTSGGGDTINVGVAVNATAATIAAGATINGGGGATLVTDAANYAAISGFSAANRALVTGFSNVAVDDALRNGATYDVNAIGATNFSTVGVAAGGTAQVNVNTGATVTIQGNIGGFGGNGLATNTGTLVVSEASVAQGATNNTLTLGYQNHTTAAITSNVQTPGVQTVNVIGNATATNGNVLTLNLTDTAATTINFSGNDGFTFNPTAAQFTATTAGATSLLKTINGSAGTGTETINVSALSSTLNSPLSVTTGSGNDVVTVKDFDRVTTGATTGTQTTTANFDLINVNTTTSGQTYSSVLDAKAGLHVEFTGAAANQNSQFVNQNGKIVLNSTAVFQDYLDASHSQAAGTISAFDFGGNTYLVENATMGGTFQNGQDSVIQLVGIHTVSTTANTVGGVAQIVLTS